MKITDFCSFAIAWLVILIASSQCLAAEEPQQASADAIDNSAKELIDELTKEIARSKKPDFRLYEQRGDAHMQQKKYREAFADYSHSIVLQQESKTFPYFQLMARARAAVRLGMYEQAILDVKLATKVQPKQPAPFATLAILLSGSPAKYRDPAEALELAELAGRFPDDMGQPKLMQAALAAAHSVNGNFEKAIEHQKKVIALSEGKEKEYYEGVLARYRKKLGYRLENVED